MDFSCTAQTSHELLNFFSIVQNITTDYSSTTSALRISSEAKMFLWIRHSGGLFADFGMDSSPVINLAIRELLGDRNYYTTDTRKVSLNQRLCVQNLQGAITCLVLSYQT